LEALLPWFLLPFLGTGWQVRLLLPGLVRFEWSPVTVLARFQLPTVTDVRPKIIIAGEFKLLLADTNAPS
jgi:hypothetical protein